MDIAIELDAYCVADRFLEPGDGIGGQPVTDLAGQLDLQIAVKRFQVIAAGEHRALKTKADHADLFVIGHVEDTLGVVQVVGVELTMLRHRAADPLGKLQDLRRRVVQRDVKTGHRAERQAVERDIHEIAHRGHFIPQFT